MKALIFKNKIVDVAETEFEVHESMIWIDCPDDCKAGAWELVEGNFQVIPEPEDTRSYAELRAATYPTLQDQADMAYWDRKNGTRTLDDAIEAVKARYPKP